MKSNMLERLALFVSAGLILVITGSGSLLMSGQASAEVASQGIEEVVVTARRREETAQTVPIPISALSSEYLEDRGITEIQRIEQVTPNLNFENSGVARQTAQIFLRGIGQVNWPTRHSVRSKYHGGTCTCDHS